jgi:hypothetical protein
VTKSKRESSCNWSMKLALVRDSTAAAEPEVTVNTKLKEFYVSVVVTSKDLTFTGSKYYSDSTWTGFWDTYLQTWASPCGVIGLRT